VAKVVDLFAGVGLVSTAYSLEKHSVVLASDYSPMKEEIHSINHPNTRFLLCDIRNLEPDVLPECDILHGSFPCTDTSVAGYRKGCRDGKESPMYWEFYRILCGLCSSNRSPDVITLENVEGLLTSNSGADLSEIAISLNEAGYFVDIALLNSFHFVPQSRSRLFIVGRKRRIGLDAHDLNFQASEIRPAKVAQYIKSRSQINWDLVPHSPLPQRVDNLVDVVDESDQEWWDEGRTLKLLSQMFDRHLETVVRWKNAQDRYQYGTVFRRMRTRDGSRQSTAELRADGIAGCLRTPKGGSAKQILLRAGFGTISARHLNPLECARLMGAPDFLFTNQVSANNYLFGFGDSVCVPAMRWIIQNMVNPSMDPAVVSPTRETQVSFEAMLQCAA